MWRTEEVPLTRQRVYRVESKDILVGSKHRYHLTLRAELDLTSRAAPTKLSETHSDSLVIRTRTEAAPFRQLCGIRTSGWI